LVFISCLPFSLFSLSLFFSVLVAPSYFSSFPLFSPCLFLSPFSLSLTSLLLLFPSLLSKENPSPPPWENSPMDSAMHVRDFFVALRGCVVLVLLLIVIFISRLRIVVFTLAALQLRPLISFFSCFFSLSVNQPHTVPPECSSVR